MLARPGFWVFAGERMSGRQSCDIAETLFSFELLVERVSITEEASKVSDELAIGVRLLDFPTLLIYQPQRRSDGFEQSGDSRQGEYTFNRGKSCFFQMNLNSLHNQLLNSPLYIMVLGVKEELPRLVGTSLISLATVVARIWLDVTENGVSSPSSYGERGIVAVCNLQGDTIGSISLHYKLLSVGASFLPHITDFRGDESAGALGAQGDSVIVEKVSADVFPLECGNAPSATGDLIDIKLNDHGPGKANREDRVSLVQNVPEPENEIPQKQTETDNTFEDYLNVFCPPHLFYNSSFESENKNEQEDCRNLTPQSEGFTYEDSEEEPSLKVEETRSPTMNQRLRHDAQTARTQCKSGTNLNNLGEALQQLPLLNALLVELAQLNDQGPKRPLSIHPNLAWIYRPASAEPAGEHVDSLQKAQRKRPQKTTKSASPHAKTHVPRNCSVPAKSESARVKDRQADANTSRTSPRKKCIYGTTKTFNLRRNLNSRPRNERHECLELIKNETNTSISKEKTASLNKMKANKRKSALNRSAGLGENVETIMQSMQVNTAIQETVATSQKNLEEEVGKQQSKERPSVSGRGLEVIRLPSVAVDGSVSNKTRRHSASDQSLSGSDRHGGKAESLGSSRGISPKSSSSYSSGEENQEERYDDDFNSLEPSDADSPVTSPESGKTPRSPRRHGRRASDSDSEGFRSRAVLPVPIKASTSPQRALMGTHIIRSRAHTPTRSFRPGDRHSSGSSQIVQKQPGRSRRSPGGDSFMSSEGQHSESNKNCKHVCGFSRESVSSFEPEEVEELSDELGSLDFRMQCQPISNLIVNKLPGYTL